MKVLLPFTMSFALASAAAVTQTLDPFIYGAFGKTATFSVANQLGFFTNQGLDVTLSPIPNSTFGYATLLSGGYDLLTGTVDNAVNLRFNSEKPLTVVGQLDLGPELVLAAVPGINNVLDLKGKALMVDAATSGYAFVLRKILALHGLQLGTDYTFQIVGATSTRFQLLSQGSLADGTPVFATILTYPFTSLATTANPPLPILARVSDFVAPFFSSAITVRSEDADPSANPSSTIPRFVAALLGASRFLGDPANKLCSIQAIATDNGFSDTVAEAAYLSATNSVSGETAQVDFEPSRLGILNVVDVRMLSGGFAQAGLAFDFADALVPGDGLLLDLRVRDVALGLVQDLESGECPLL
ncbi:hypothetical protein BXZ70DRAFT_711752 [Cristinia sonorae]|uniref:SsuA/THI5-like domain-containing protein n=1 Tax=Cristinia sonorae TaxID=1940300 RepID=A0A8K0XJM4_9AGAR|nr:hypothetical protein BXZ70DRAFT_711752 [Cristinia sonorae]